MLAPASVGYEQIESVTVLCGASLLIVCINNDTLLHNEGEEEVLEGLYYRNGEGYKASFDIGLPQGWH